MAFSIPENLHKSLFPIAWMIGKWEGDGNCEYPTIQPFKFFQEVVFNQDGQDFLNYYSRCWKMDDDGKIGEPFFSETGFWRVKEMNDQKVLEVVIAQSGGITEGWVGVVGNSANMQLVMDQGYSTPSAPITTAGQRLYGHVEGELFFAYDRAAEGHPLQAYMWSSMKRAE